MFWHVSLTKWSKERNSLVSMFLWGWRQSCQTSWGIESFTVSLVLQIVMWCKSNAKEPSTPEKNYFSMITLASQSLVTVSYLDEQNVHVFTHAPYSPCDFFLFSGEEAETGRLDTWSVNICHFRAHDFSPDYITRMVIHAVRRSWKSWQCIEKRE